MLSADSQLCVAVLLAAFCHALAVVNHKTLVSSHNPDINTLVNHGFGIETRRWKCTVITSDRRYEMKTTIAMKRLRTEHWQIWLSNRVSIWSYFIYSLRGFNEESNEIRAWISAVCTLQSSSTAATSHQKNTGFSADDLEELFAGYPWWSEQPSQPCIKITKLTGNNTDDLDDTFGLYHWQVVVFGVFVALIVVIHGIILVYYTPAFLCFFSPTVVKENGVRQIILEGASPVSFRSLLGNYFFSEDDGTIWHKARTFTLLVVVLPGVYLPPAIALDKNYCWEEFNLLPDVAFGAMHLFHPFYLVCYACYVLHAICICFLTVKSSDGETCTVCRRVQPRKIYNCRDQELLGQIIHHLRQQPLILLKCWRLFLRYLVNYFQVCLSVVLPCKVSVSSFLGICLFPIFLLSIPLVALMLLTAVSFVAWLGLCLTSPMSTILDYVMKGRRYVHLESCSTIFAVAFLCCCLCCSPLTNLGVLAVLSFAACAIMKSVFWAITLLFSEDSLPYLACFILVFYYVCSSYSSFTSKYHFLALTLYKHHKTSPVVADQGTERNTLIPDTVMRIPKELFDVACEQLMPIRVSVCILVLRVASILTFVFLVFFLTMLYHVSVTPVTRALLTFLSGLLPRIIDIFIDGGQQNIATTAIDEKVPYIIEHYNNSKATEQNIEIVIM